jgi:hypothetical protein
MIIRTVACSVVIPFLFIFAVSPPRFAKFN